MQSSHLRTIALSFTLGTCLSWADTITLKNGEVLEGEVIGETSDSYNLRVTLSSGIRDRRTVKRTDVVSIKKANPDEKPYAELQKILPVPDRTSAAEYSAFIEGQVKPFLNNYPKSKYADEVKKILAELEKEQARAKAGDIKLEGEWIAADEWNADAINNDSKVLFAEIKKLAQARRFRQAMIKIDELVETLPGSEGAVKARELATEILPVYGRSIARMEANAKTKLTEHKAQIEKLSRNNAARAREAFEQKMARHKRAVEKAKENGTRWIPANEFDSRGLNRLKRHIESVQRKLERPPRQSRKTGQLFKDAWAAASSGDERSVKRLLSKLRSAKVDEKYRDMITAQLIANPAPEPVVEEKEEKPAKPEKPVEEKKKKKKPKIKREENDESKDEMEEESGNGFLMIIGGIMFLALIGILVTLAGGKKKKQQKTA